MILDDFKESVTRTSSSNENPTLTVSNIAMGLSGELGEVIDILKKHLHHNHPLKSEKLAEEIGDVLFYVQWLCNFYDFSLEHIMQGNIDKLQKRYPKGFSAEASLNREV